MSVVRSPASSIAARHASSVSSNGSRSTRRPTSDWPMPVMQTLRSGISRATSAPAPGVGLEQRQPHVAARIAMMLEYGAQRHADAHVLGLATDEVGGEPNAGVLLDLDDRHHEGQRGPRHPRLVVDREGVQGRAARDRARRQILGVTLRADRLRRMDPLAAGVAAQEAQLTVLAAGPEMAIARV